MSLVTRHLLIVNRPAFRDILTDLNNTYTDAAARLGSHTNTDTHPYRNRYSGMHTEGYTL